MTIITLHPRPTVSNPVLKNDTIAAALSELDAHISLLRCAADSAAMDDENDAVEQGQLTETLYFLHGKLRAGCDRLFSLL
jgi:hypothetical protein